MQFIFNPLIINILFLSSIIILFRVNKQLLGSLIYRSSNVFQYKIRNIYLSLTFVSCYIGVIIILLYGMRVYNLPRSIDLKLLPSNLEKVKDLWIILFGDYSYMGKIYCLVIIALLLLFISLLIIKGHKLAYKEIHKIFLWLTGQEYFERHKNKFFSIVITTLFDISLNYDFLFYILKKVTYSFKRNAVYRTDKYFDPTKWPKYHPFIILLKIKKYYKIIIVISPILVMLYDCIFNNFVITHVFYYLIFYIPLRLLKRISDCVSMNAPYITKWLYELYYKDEDCLYAASPTLKAILDNFILSGVEMNFTLGVQNQAELVVCALTRFELADKHGPLDETYVNEDSQFLHTYDRIHYYHAIPDENGNPTHGPEWVIIADKTKHLK